MKRIYIFLLCSLLVFEAQSAELTAPATDSVAIAAAVAEAVAKKESVLLSELKKYVSQSTLNVKNKPKAPVRQCFLPIYEDDLFELGDYLGWWADFLGCFRDPEYPYPLYGCVKSVSRVDYDSDFYMSFNAQGNLSSRSLPVSDSTDPSSKSYEYNANNNLVGAYYYLYRYDIEPRTIEAPSMKVKKLDSQGRVIERDCYSGGVCWNRKYATIKTLYSENGRIVEDLAFYTYENKTEKVIRKYNSGGRLIEWANYDHADSLIFKCTRKYDKKEKKAEIAKYESGSLVSKRLLYYSLNGILVFTERYDGKGVLENVTFYSYDKQGNMIEKRKYDASGELQSKDSFKYDHMGNVIETRTSWCEFGSNSEAVSKYEITYYK